MTTNKTVLAWIDEMKALVNPENVVFVDGSEEQIEKLRAEAVAIGELEKLNEELLPDCYLHRTKVNDVARVEGRTFICSREKENAGPTNNWMDPKEAYEMLYGIAKDSYKGRTMYVIPFSMGPIGSPLAKIGVEFSKEDESRLLRVKDWICNHQPSKLYKLLPERNSAYLDALTEEDKVVLNKLYEYCNIAEKISEKEVQEYLYSIINDPNLTKKENQLKQQHFFKIFYNALFGTDMGPRLYLFLSAIDKEQYLHLLH